MLLLEFVDIDSKDDLKSLLLVDSVLCIMVFGDIVIIQVFFVNGVVLLELLDGVLFFGIINQCQFNGCILIFLVVSVLFDEDVCFCLLLVFDVFCFLQELVSVLDNECEVMFFGGLFVYDLVVGFEDFFQL